jgi:DNA-binding transcriptional MocR family regulator
VARQGIDRGLLAEAVRKHRIAAILVEAACHNVLGDCSRDESKAALVDFGLQHDIPIIEGDPFGELVFGGPRPRTLKAFDSTGMVLHGSSLAHYVAPGFNLGWVSAGRWQPELERLKSFSSVAHARLPQLAMAEFLESGAFDRHVKQLRAVLWQTVEAARQEVLRQFPKGTRVSRPEGGFVLWVQLPDGHDGVELQRRAAAVGIRLLPGVAFSPSQQYRSCVRIACGYPFDVLKPALRTLSQLA